MSAAGPQRTPSRAQDRKALRLIGPFLWPEDDPALRRRLVGTSVLLVLYALLNAGAPILFAEAVDHLGLAVDSLLN